MYTFFLVILILDGIVLSTVVLLQAGQGGGLAGMGGGMATDNVIGGRQAATLLTRMSWITGGIFLGLALLLSIISSRNEVPTSILRDQFGQPAATTPATQPPSTLPGAQPSDPAAPPATTPEQPAAPLPGTTPDN